MLIIERTHEDNGTLTLRLAGRLIGAWVHELAGECERILAAGTRLGLDLSLVSFVDSDGADLLCGLARRNVALRHCSPFVVEQVGMRA